MNKMLGIKDHKAMVAALQAKTASGELEAYKPTMNLTIPDAFDSATAFPNCIAMVRFIVGL